LFEYGGEVFSSMVMVINWGSNGSQTVIGWRWVVIECDGWGSDFEVDDPLSREVSRILFMRSGPHNYGRPLGISCTSKVWQNHLRCFPWNRTTFFDDLRARFVYRIWR
jgi:hypothetical protein